jgi:long-subunit acyl-CoA synthetase (AMP-forming)
LDDYRQDEEIKRLKGDKTDKHDLSEMPSSPRLEALPYPDCDTLLKAFRRNVEKIQNADMMGTHVNEVYQWTTWAQAEERARHIAFGIKEFNLAPDIDAEDTVYRFIGIQSKNREDWVIAHLAYIH